MTDERLRAALHAELDSIPLPPRFERPSSLVPDRRLSSRHLAWAGAAALMLVLVAISPVGARAAQKLAAQFAQSTSHGVTSEPLPTPPPYLNDLSKLEPGQFTYVPVEGLGEDLQRKVTAITFAELERDTKVWPLPTYHRPAPDTKVLLSSQPVLYEQGIQLNYRVQLAGKEYWVYLGFEQLATPRSEAEVQSAGKMGHMSFRPDVEVRKETITVHGQEAVVYFTDGKHRIFSWYSTWGHGTVITTLPLEELERLLNSMPDL